MGHDFDPLGRHAPLEQTPSHEFARSDEEIDVPGQVEDEAVGPESGGVAGGLGLRLEAAVHHGVVVGAVLTAPAALALREEIAVRAPQAVVVHGHDEGHAEAHGRAMDRRPERRVGVVQVYDVGSKASHDLGHGPFLRPREGHLAKRCGASGEFFVVPPQELHDVTVAQEIDLIRHVAVLAPGEPVEAVGHEDPESLGGRKTRRLERHRAPLRTAGRSA
jgi:hypothetical protein